MEMRDGDYEGYELDSSSNLIHCLILFTHCMSASIAIPIPPGPVASCIVCDTCSIYSVNTHSAVRHSTEQHLLVSVLFHFAGVYTPC